MTYESMLAETVAFRGHKGDVGEAYYARPLGGGPYPGVVLIHHMPGWDESIKEDDPQARPSRIGDHLAAPLFPRRPRQPGRRRRARARGRRRRR